MVQAAELSTRDDKETKHIILCIRQNEWWEGPPMLTPRKSHCSGVHSGYLYAAGGTDVQKPVTAAERIRLEGLNRETKVFEMGFDVLVVLLHVVHCCSFFALCVT